MKSCARRERIPRSTRLENAYHGGGCNFGGHELANLSRFRGMEREKNGPARTGNVGWRERKVEEEMVRHGSFRLNRDPALGLGRILFVDQSPFSFHRETARLQ